MPATKSLRSGTCASTLLPSSEVGLRALARRARGAVSRRRTRRSVGTPCSLGRRGDVGRRLDAEHGDAALRRSTAAGSRRCWRSRRPGCRVRGPSRSAIGVGVAPRVLEPGVGVGGEVGVLGEDLLGGDVLLELHQEALVADVDVQRVERLHRGRAARRSGSSRTAATCRGRRTCARAAPRRSGSAVDAHSGVARCVRRSSPRRATVLGAGGRVQRRSRPSRPSPSSCWMWSMRW